MNTKKLSYLFVAIALILVLVATVLTVAFNTNYAYADYLDVISDLNSVVNFNQLFNNTISRGNYNTITVSKNNTTYSINGYFTGYSLNLAFNETSPSISIFANHVYYLDYKLKVSSGSTPNLRVFNTSGGVLSVGNNAQILRPSANATVSVGFQVLPAQNSSSNPYNFSVTPMLIDLTQMFGSGNEPTLSQAQELFIADYYIYNSGTALFISSVETYNKGVEDTLNSFDLTLSQYLVGSTAFAFNNSTITDSMISYDNTVNAYVFKNVIGVPLMDTIESGTNFTVDFTLWCLSSGENQSYYMSQYLNFGYVDSNNNLVNISKISSAAYVGEAEVQYTGVFVLPVSTDTIYMWVSYQNDNLSDDRFVALDSNITFRSLNVASLIKASYASGLQANKDFYSVGGDGYNQIYHSGYNAGTMAVTPYTFSRLLTAVIEAPLGAVLEIFNFDFMGYNFKNFITVMFTLCLIIAIVRMFMGGKE